MVNALHDMKINLLGGINFHTHTLHVVYLKVSGEVMK